MGPHQAFGNIPRSIEFAVEAVTRLIKYCTDNGITRAEAKKKGVEEWTVGFYMTSSNLLISADKLLLRIMLSRVVKAN